MQHSDPGQRLGVACARLEHRRGARAPWGRAVAGRASAGRPPADAMRQIGLARRTRDPSSPVRGRLRRRILSSGQVDKPRPRGWATEFCGRGDAGRAVAPRRPSTGQPRPPTGRLRQDDAPTLGPADAWTLLRASGWVTVPALQALVRRRTARCAVRADPRVGPCRIGRKDTRR